MNQPMTAAEMTSEVFLPISLAIIMLGMGMTLIPADFTRIIKFPKAIFIGLINQFIFLPIVGFSLAVAFNLSPVIAVGLMILATCPGGPTSNIITQVCKGNIALSVTLTAIASILSVFTIPFVLSYALTYFGAGTNVTMKLPILDTIIQIMGVTVVPISMGMLIRRFKTDLASRAEKPMRIASTVIFILVFIAVLAANFNIIGKAMKEVGLVTLLLNVLTLGLGYGSARLFKLNVKSAISITMESGIQNGALAFVIATSILNNLEMGIPTAAYVIWMYITGGVLMWYFGKRLDVDPTIKRESTTKDVFKNK
jgi:BASS family bile acid:Na+ symporter